LCLTEELVHPFEISDGGELFRECSPLVSDDAPTTSVWVEVILFIDLHSIVFADVAPYLAIGDGTRLHLFIDVFKGVFSIDPTRTHSFLSEMRATTWFALITCRSCLTA